MIVRINVNWSLNTLWIYSMKLVTTVRYVQLPFFRAARFLHSASFYWLHRSLGTPWFLRRPHEKLQSSLGTPRCLRRAHEKFWRWSGTPWCRLAPDNSSSGAGVEGPPETQQISVLKEIQKI